MSKLNDPALEESVELESDSPGEDRILDFIDGTRFERKFRVQLQAGLILIQTFENLAHLFTQLDHTAIDRKGIFEQSQIIPLLFRQDFLIFVQEVIVDATKKFP